MKPIYLIFLLCLFIYDAEASKSKMNIQIEKINQEFINLDDPLKFNSFFQNVKKISSELPSHLQLKLYASMSNLLQTTEGLAWKEEGFYRQSDFIYSLFISFMRGIYAPDYIVGTHVRKLGRYFVEPHSSDLQFSNIHDFQDFLVNYSLPALNQLISVLDEITMDPKFEFVFDQYIMKGFVSKDKSTDRKDWYFVEEAERYKLAKSEHLRLFKADLLNIAGMLSYFCAYDLNEALFYSDSLVKKSIIRGIKKIIFFKKDVEPLTTEDKVSELFKEKYKFFLTLRNNQLTIKALTYWHKATSERLLAMQAISKNYAVQNDYIVDTEEIKWKSKKEVPILNERLKFLTAALEHKNYTLNSNVTRLKVELNPFKLFEIKDYKKIMPKTFYGESQRHLWKNKEVDDILIHKVYGQLMIWDFNYGKPVLFRDPTFNGLLVGSTDDNLMEKLKSIKLNESIAPFVNLLPL